MPDARCIAAPLLSWYDEHGRDLPWRRTRDPYAIWVSEVIMQQTRIATGQAYWHRFLERFPTVGDLAAADEDDVLAVWSGLGFYRRARNLHRAARVVRDQHGGALPRDPGELGGLPGVGRYTVGAILSAAWNDRLPILDGNVIRVLSRVFEVDGPVDKAATRRELWAWAEAVLPEGRPGDFNQALMDLGATVCTPTSPRCSGCPLAMDCGANSTGRQGELPVGGKRQAVRFETRVAVALVRSDGRFLVRQRPEGGLLPRLWELPGHEVPEGSTADAEASGMAAELGGGPVELCGRSEHRFSHRHWTTDVYRGPSPGGDGTWVSRDELAALGLPTVSRKAIDLALGGAPTQLPLL